MRFYVVFLSNLMYLINFTESPFPEMGNLSGDKAYPDSVPIWMNIWIRVVLPIINIWYSMKTMSDYSGISLIEWCSFILLSGGFVLRMWCYYELGQYFTKVLGVREGHILIKTGPYKWLVHPSYLGQILVVFNFMYLIQAHIVLTIFLMVLYASGCQTRMKKEEEIMKEHFGEEYDNYLKERKRLIPYVY